jgi:hypothetical protein
MLVIRVELHSAVTGKMTELARMKVCNEGGTADLRDYGVYVFRGRDKEALDKQTVHRTGKFGKFPSQRLHVWNLVLCALVAAGYKGTS